MPLWLQILLTLVAPAAGLGGALGGVWLGGRLSAVSAEERWRRDRLLQFCVDLIAACPDVMAAARSIHYERQAKGSADPPDPYEAIQRMKHAAGSVRLLSNELARPATDFANLTVAVVDAARKDDEAFAAALRDAETMEDQFRDTAHDRLAGTYC